MKTKSTVGILAILTVIGGCATHPKGPAYGNEREFRQQIEASVPVKDWGYRVQEIRFSADYHKALVTFAVPDKTNLTEVVLEDDGFRRYKGVLSDYKRMQEAPKTKPGDPGFEKSVNEALQYWQASIRVTFPAK